MTQPTLTLAVEDLEKMIKNAHDRGATKGQAYLIYYLHMMKKGYIDKTALNQNDMDPSTWTRLGEVIETIMPTIGKNLIAE